MKKTLKIKWMHCASCANIIEKSLNSKDLNVSVNYALASAKLSWDFDLKKIEQEINKLGFWVVKEWDIDSEDLEKIFFRKFIYSLALTIPAALTMFFDMSLKFELILLILAILNVFVIWFNFHKSFLQKLIKFQLNMDSLISIWTLTAIFYSIYWFINWNFLWHFLEWASFIITFILLWKYLEAKTKKSAWNALKALFSLQVKDVLKINWEKILVENLKIWDEILVKAWEKIPVDWLIFDWNSEIDESMLTGENVPKSKKSWDHVFSWTLNLNWILKIKVTKNSGETFLAKILEAVEDSQNSKAPIQKLADTISSYFVPVIILLSILSYFYWIYILWVWNEKALLTAVSVLVVACPCALWLATPIALMVASGQWAKNWILIKKTESLEKSKKITAITFDKTGTLTTWKPTLSDFEIFWDLDKKEILKIVYSISNLSNHPFSKAISNNLKKDSSLSGNDNLVKILNFKEIHWKWVSWEVFWKKFYFGSKNLAQEKILNFNKKDSRLRGNDSFLEKINKFTKSWETPICLVLDWKLTWVFWLKDELKKWAKELIKKLTEKWIKTFLITWDNKKTAEIIWKELWIKKIFAEVLPKEKAEKIKEIQDSGEVTAFVWDWINDAVALAQSDLAIAMWNWSEIASESAEIIILNWNPLKVLDAIELSKKTYKIIKQNLFWAFFYNIAMVPLAFFWLFQPAFASLAMSFSSVSVVLNSLRIKKQ